jgi:hypothetical protein
MMDRSAGYQVRILVTGQLPPAWSDLLADLALDVEPDGTTLISGCVADQAALHGLLDTIRDLGLGLVTVETAVIPSPSNPLGG